MKITRSSATAKLGRSRRKGAEASLRSDIFDEPSQVREWNIAFQGDGVVGDDGVGHGFPRSRRPPLEIEQPEVCHSAESGSRILAFPLDAGLCVSGPFFVDLDEHGADESQERVFAWKDPDPDGAPLGLLPDGALHRISGAHPAAMALGRRGTSSSSHAASFGAVSRWLTTKSARRFQPDKLVCRPGSISAAGPCARGSPGSGRDGWRLAPHGTAALPGGPARQRGRTARNRARSSETMNSTPRMVRHGCRHWSEGYGGRRPSFGKGSPGTLASGGATETPGTRRSSSGPMADSTAASRARRPCRILS